MDTEFSLQPFLIVATRLEGLARSAVALLPNIIAATLIVLLTAIAAWLLGKAVARGFRRSGARPALVEALHFLIRAAVWIAGLLVTATVLFPTLTPANALAGLGIGSLAVGLAFRDIFENFLAGLLILLRKPMRTGDDIECQEVFGRVERITMRDTWLRKRSGELVLLPNSYLFKHPVEVLTDRDLRRITVEVGVAYGEDIEASRAVIRQAVEGLPSVSPLRRVDVFASGFGASSIDFMVRWWTGSAPIDEYRARDEGVTAIKAALDAAGIEIPFPHRTITFKWPAPRRRPPEE
jgi:small-conductance mechanosensitive channel